MSLSFKHRAGAGILVRVLIVGALLIFGAYMAAKDAHANDGDRPMVTVQLRQGYGLSSTPRDGWLSVFYHGKKWWVTPVDLKIPQPCVRTYNQPDYRVCFLDEQDGAWVR